MKTKYEDICFQWYPNNSFMISKMLISLYLKKHFPCFQCFSLSGFFENDAVFLYTFSHTNILLCQAVIYEKSSEYCFILKQKINFCLTVVKCLLHKEYGQRNNTMTVYFHRSSFRNGQIFICANKKIKVLQYQLSTYVLIWWWQYLQRKLLNTNN